MVVELDDFLVAAVMAAQQNFIADRVAGQEGLVDGIFPIVVLLGHMILFPQSLIGQLLQQDHRVQLLRVSHQHQVLSPDDGHQGHRRVALAGLVHDDHVEHRLRLSQSVGGDTGGDHDGENILELLHVFCLPQVFRESRHLFFLLCIEQNLS